MILIISVLYANVRSLEFLFQFSPLRFFLHVFPFVIDFLSAAETHVELHETALKVKTEGHQGITLFLDFPEQAVYLSFVEKKLTVSKRIFIKNITAFIRIDMHTDDEALSVSNLAEGLLDGSLPETERLYFGSEELYSAFYIFFYKKVMIRFLVVGY